MVEVRISREALEALAAEPLTGGVTRLDVQAAGLADGTDEVQASRVAIEVLAAEPLTGGVSRLDVQAAGLADATIEVQASRVAVEVLGMVALGGGVTRLDVQAAGLADAATEVQITRIAGEALARQGSAGPVSPLALGDDAHIFLHNWVKAAELTTSFRNDISRSPVTGAESRLGLSIKPYRTMKLQWQVCPQPGPGQVQSLVELERLEVLLRRLTNARFQVPIYKDQAILGAGYTSVDTTILLDTSVRRFFPGARVAIVQLDACNQVTSFSFHIIDVMTSASLTFDAQLGITVPAGSYVFPMMDCEVLLDVQANYTTSRVPTVTLTVAEAPGDSQLPPLKSDTPTGAEQYAEAGEPLRPIWFEEPNWLRGIKKGRSRQGTRTRGGRADFVNVEATRSRQTHSYQLQGKRAEMWNALVFFETRRGSLRAFWHIDQDQYLEAVDIDASGTFVGVSKIGDVADFTEEMDFVGIVMDDGKVFVRKVVTIQEILTVFRMTLDQSIDLNLDPADVARVARARLTRYKTDSITERWTHTGLMTMSVQFIEVLDEGDQTT